MPVSPVLALGHQKTAPRLPCQSSDARAGKICERCGCPADAKRPGSFRAKSAGWLLRSARRLGSSQALEAFQSGSSFRCGRSPRCQTLRTRDARRSCCFPPGSRAGLPPRHPPRWPQSLPGCDRHRCRHRCRHRRRPPPPHHHHPPLLPVSVPRVLGTWQPPMRDPDRPAGRPNRLCHGPSRGPCRRRRGALRPQPSPTRSSRRRGPSCQSMCRPWPWSAPEPPPWRARCGAQGSA
mmetsp:Transcript_16834/g.53547  ORF Transcript_16834/g.53547 Transcript_16834/m.53547 type:complete len:236 (-) Transcript_16834:603-1310(-)